MSATDRRRSPGVRHVTDWLPLVGAVAFVVVLGSVYGALWLAHTVNGAAAPPSNPFDVLFAYPLAERPWPVAATWWLLGLVAVVLVVAVVIGGRVVAVRRRRTRVDPAAHLMGRGRDIAGLSRDAVTATAARLGCPGGPGVLVGYTVASGAEVWASWEDQLICIAGPRTGKTTSLVIPTILAAPGPVIATSNKRDLVDATRGPRAAEGDVWVFDPQGVVGEAPSWFWNPLDYVTDETKAAVLADVFATAKRDVTARTDAYFDTEARNLLAALLLAAAAGGRDLTAVYTWLNVPTNDEPVEQLRAHGYDLVAVALNAMMNLADKQRDGLYGTARSWLDFVRNSAAMRWVTPDPDRPAFDPHAFVRSTATLYSISREGRGAPVALVTAMTVAVTEAAETYAASRPGGRLPVPLVAVLDEAANVCRWSELPNLYSHYGSRGIVVMTVLQSRAQGVETWGKEGMDKLWSSSNVAIYGGGVTEVEFLRQMSDLIGAYQRETGSISHSRQGQSRQIQHSREQILDVSDLAALPAGRLVVFASGSRPVLCKTRPWMDGPHAEAIRASLAAASAGEGQS